MKQKGMQNFMNETNIIFELCILTRNFSKILYLSKIEVKFGNKINIKNKT